MGKEERRIETEKALGRTDYFEFWLEEATRQAAEKGFPTGFLVEALSIVKSAFNENWIKEQIKAIVVKEEIRKRNRNVPRWIATPGANQISSLLELAVYLKRLHSLPNFPRVLEMMKELNTFDSAFLQASYAYRFMRLGADSMEFEPLVDAGKAADILFKWNSTDFLCECYSPKATGNQAYMDFMSYNADKVLKSADSLGHRVYFLVRLSTDFPSKPESRSKLQTDCIAVLKELVPGLHRKVNTEWAEVEVWETSQMKPDEEEKLLAELEPEITCGLDHSLVAKTDLRPIVAGKDVPKTIKSRFLMAVPDEAPSWEAIVEELANKIEAKIVQLRKKDLSPKGLLIVETPYAAFFGLDEAEKQKHLERLKKKLEPHANVSGLILSYYTWSSRFRHMYVGYSVQTKIDPQVEELFGKLIELENRQDVIDDHK